MSNARIAEIASIIAGESNEPADAVIWRDCFCFECGMNECINSTALRLAEKVEPLGWIAVDSLNLNCPACASYEPPVSEFWAEAEDRYDRWKGERCEA